jgi:hypothetical protein
VSAPNQTNPGKKASGRRSRNFSKSRWYHQKDGRDVGPFRPGELKQLLLRGEVRADSSVRESAGTDWRPLHEIDGFVSILKEIKVELASRAQDRELDKQVDRVRKKRGVPLMLGVLAVLIVTIVGGWYGWQRLQSREAAAPSGYTTELYRNLELAEIPARAYLNTSGPIRWADEKIAVPPQPKEVAKARKASTKRRSGPRYIKNGEDLAPEDNSGVRDLDFSSDGAEAGRDLSMADVANVKNRTVPRLRQCAVAEATRNGAFPGTSVRFKILGSGKVGGLRIGKNGKRSGAFSACVKGAIANVSVGAFDGPGRTITVPLKIQR